jgi:hypothetical protein
MVMAIVGDMMIMPLIDGNHFRLSKDDRQG